MNVKELRLGNLIKVMPRENQEGLLAITEIQKETVIGEMVSPRPGYYFRIKFDEIVYIPLSEEWLLNLGFTSDPDQPEIWHDSRKLLNFYFSNTHKLFYEKGAFIGQKPIEYVHHLQNAYYFLTGQELMSGAIEERPVQ